MDKLLSSVHKIVSQSAGEIAVALVLRKIQGGKPSLERWENSFRKAADMIAEKLKEKDHANPN